MKKRFDRVYQYLSSPWLVGQLTIWGSLIVSSLVVTLLLRFTPLSESLLPTLSYIINVIIIFFGGYCAGRVAGKRGWYYGGLQGLIYALVLILFGFLAFDLGTRLHPMLLCVWGFAMSSLGGMFGVNHTYSK